MENGITKKVIDKAREFMGIHRTGVRLLKIAAKIDSSAMPLGMIQAVFQAVNTYLGLFLMARLIDSLLAGDFSRAFFFGGMTAFTAWLFGMAGTVFSGLQKRSADRFLTGFYIMLRKKALSLDYETMEQPGTADMILRSERTAMMYGGLENIIRVYQGMLENFLISATAVGMTVALCFSRGRAQEGMLAFAAQPAVSALFMALISIAAIWVDARGNKRLEDKKQGFMREHTDVEGKIGYLTRQMLEDYQAGKVLRLYDMKEMLLDNFKKSNDESLAFFRRINAADDHRELSRGSVNSIYMVCIYLLVAVKALAGAITVGAFTQYAGALAKLVKGVQNFSWMNSRLKLCGTYMEDFLKLMDMESRHATGSIPVEKRLDGEYEIAFEDVSFHYPGSEEMVLKHVSCRLNMKDKLALVGKNGAGKTTFIKLLCRLYEPVEGVITLNGIDIRKYREEEYRELFSVVFQDFKLFAFPVWCNLTTGCERQDERIWDCLERVGADSLVKDMPEGLDTVLYKDKEGGVDISGGEAQKLALARALYKDAPFMVLDEPTAALDPVSEAQIYQGFHQMVKDKTSIYISHRMSSCRFCDDIVVFDQGGIAERGSHEELLSRQGLYAEMWNAQAKYYAEEL